MMAPVRNSLTCHILALPSTSSAEINALMETHIKKPDDTMIL